MWFLEFTRDQETEEAGRLCRELQALCEVIREVGTYDRSSMPLFQSRVRAVLMP